jgi:hypothetical protein
MQSTRLCVQAGQVYADLTGRFPHQSSGGNKYILALYDYNSNNIMMRAMKSRTENDVVAAVGALICTSTDRGLKPQLQ